MKHRLAQMVGKQIAAVVLAENGRDPKLQVFLAFSDGTSFEFRGESLSGCAVLDRSAGIMESLERSGAVVRKVFGDVSATMPTPGASVEAMTLEGLLDRDLTAWRIAKAAIAKAKDA